MKVQTRILALRGEDEALHENEQPVPLACAEMLAKPMSVDEAVMPLELSWRDELVFADQENDRLNILYRKADDSVGCVETESV